MRHDEDKLMEGIDTAMDRHGLMTERQSVDYSALDKALAKAVQEIAKAYGVGPKTAKILHGRLMQDARGFVQPLPATRQ